MTRSNNHGYWGYFNVGDTDQLVVKHVQLGNSCLCTAEKTCKVCRLHMQSTTVLARVTHESCVGTSAPVLVHQLDWHWLEEHTCCVHGRVA